MLSAIMVIGAGVVVLAVVYGLIAIVLVSVNRIQMLLRDFRSCGLTVGAAWDGFSAMVADARIRPGGYLLGVVGFCAFALFAEYILLGLVAFGTLAILLSAIGRWRGFGIDECLVRYLSYPLFANEIHHAPRDGAKAPG